MIPLGVLGAAHVAASAGGLVADYVTAIVDPANASTYTFASTPLGAAVADRTVIVAFGCRVGTSLTVNSVTIGGVSATIDYQGSFSGSVVAFARAAVPSGTTGSVVVACSATAVRAGLGVWRITGGAPSLTGTDASNDATGTLTVTVPSGGFAVASAAGSSSSPFTTFSNPDYNLAITGEAGCVAGGRAATGTVSYSGGGTTHAAALAYEPA